MVKKLYNKGLTETSQLAILIGMVGGGMLIGSLASVLVWKAMTGQGIMNMAEDMMDPKYAGAIKVVQLVSTLFIFFLPAVAYAFISFRNGWLALGFNGQPWLKPLVASMLILLASLPVIGVLTDLNHAIYLPGYSKKFFDDIEKSYEEQVKVIGDVRTTGQYLLSLFMIALLPAIFEETLFRGGLQNMLSRFKRPAGLYMVILAAMLVAIKTIWFNNSINNLLFYGILVVLILLPFIYRKFNTLLNQLTGHYLFPIIFTAIIFSAIHGSWYGFIPRLALGILLGLIFFYTQNIFYNIFLHFINNASVVTIMYVSARQQKPVEVNDDYNFPWWAAIISVGLLILLFRWLLQMPRSQQPEEVVIERYNPFAYKQPAESTENDEPSSIS